MSKRPGLPAYHRQAEPADWAAWSSAPFVVTYADSGAPVLPTLTSVQVHNSASQPQVTLGEKDNPGDLLAVGTHGCTTATPTDSFGKPIPVASAGGWSDPSTLRVEVIFLETPHRIDIECSLDDRRACVTWRLPPLGASISPTFTVRASRAFTAATHSRPRSDHAFMVMSPKPTSAVPERVF